MTIEVGSTLPLAVEPEEKHHHESYSALVWRRLKRSWTGLLGLILVCLLILMAVFADFLSPVDPKVTDVAFAQPQTISFRDKDGNFVFPPRSYPVRETEELDPITFQPIIGPDYENPQVLGFFVKGAPYRLLGLIPAERHLFGAVDGTPVHLLGTDKFGRDVLSRILYGSRISLMIALTVVFIVTVVGTTVGMFREELDDLKNLYLGRLSVLHILESEAQDIDLFSGRLDLEKCTALFRHWIDVKSADIAFICGPEPMMQAVAAALRAHGVSDSRIRFELFGSSQPGRARRRTASPSGTDGGSRCEATVTLDGATRSFTLPKRGQSLLEAALENRMDAPYACKAGVCSS